MYAKYIFLTGKLEWLLSFLPLLMLVVKFLLLTTSQQLYAQEFSLNFQQDEVIGGVTRLDNVGYVVCNMAGISDVRCGGDGVGTESGSHIDGTTFLQETLEDANGNQYWHIIVGDFANDGFAQETFIKANSSNPICYRGGAVCSDSVSDMSIEDNTEFNRIQPYLAGANSAKTGTGTANPNSVIFRQLMRDDEMSYEFFKAEFDKKHILTQNMNAPGIAVNFMLDMSALTFNDDTPINPATQMINSVELTAADAPKNIIGAFQQLGVGNFDMGIGTGVTVSRDLIVSEYVNAGGYTYTPGTGPYDYGGSGGVYSFGDGSGATYDPTTEWSTTYCDPSQNPDWGDGACLGDSSEHEDEIGNEDSIYRRSIL